MEVPAPPPTWTPTGSSTAPPNWSAGVGISGDVPTDRRAIRSRPNFCNQPAGSRARPKASSCWTTRRRRGPIRRPFTSRPVRWWRAASTASVATAMTAADRHRFCAASSHRRHQPYRRRRWRVPVRPGRPASYSRQHWRTLATSARCVRPVRRLSAPSRRWRRHCRPRPRASSLTTSRACSPTPLSCRRPCRRAATFANCRHCCPSTNSWPRRRPPSALRFKSTRLPAPPEESSQSSRRRCRRARPPPISDCCSKRTQ